MVMKYQEVFPELSFSNYLLHKTYVDGFVDLLHRSDDCFEWLGAFRNGHCWYKEVDASRIAYELATGIHLPEDIVITRLCNNPICMNAQHLLVRQPTRFVKPTKDLAFKTSETVLKVLRKQKDETFDAMLKDLQNIIQKYQ